MHKILEAPFIQAYDQGFFFFLNKFIYLFLAALGIRCCARAFSSCGELGLLFVVHGLLIVVVSPAAEHRLQQLWRTGSAAPRHVGSSPTRE